MLRVRLFGAFALESDGVALPMPERRRACSLLAWLALHEGLHPRSEVAGRFWPDVLDASARKSLRTELVAVRRALGAAGDGALVATRDLVGLGGGHVVVDAREFESLVRAGRLDAAVDLCDGELLPGLDAEWVYAARESHRQRLGDVLERLAAQAEASGALADAIRISRRRVALDPLREAAHRELIRRLIAADEISAARAAYDDLARRLRAELQVAPSGETRRLLTAIHAHRGAPAAGAAPPAPPPLSRRERSTFVGREDAFRWLAAQWSDARDGSGRLALIAGDPGIGKTRLACEFARAVHADGAAVLLGRCHEEALISYQPFVEAIGRYAAAVPPDMLRDQVGAVGAEIARLIPAIGRRLPDLAVPDGADAEGRRLRLFEAASALLANVSRSWPVVLLLEDLQWADRPTALLLAHIVRAAQTERVLVVSAYRDSEPAEPVSSALGELRRDRASSSCGCGACIGARSPRWSPSGSGARRRRTTRSAAPRHRGQPVLHRGGPPPPDRRRRGRRVAAPAVVHGARHPRRRPRGDRAAARHAVAAGPPRRDDSRGGRTVVLDRRGRGPRRPAGRRGARGAGGGGTATDR